MGGEIV